MIKSYKLAAAHIGVGIAAFAVASLMGVLQGLSVADVNFPQRSESLYYLSVTAHGVLMALVFTTFFIMGLGYAMCQASLDRIVGRKTVELLKVAGHSCGLWVERPGDEESERQAHAHG